MPTLNEVHFKIQDISSKYYSGAPRIHVSHLMAELKATKEDILSHLDELEKQGFICYHATLHDIFSLSAKAQDDNRAMQAGPDSRSAGSR